MGRRGGRSGTRCRWTSSRVTLVTRGSLCRSRRGCSYVPERFWGSRYQEGASINTEGPSVRPIPPRSLSYQGPRRSDLLAVPRVVRPRAPRTPVSATAHGPHHRCERRGDRKEENSEPDQVAPVPGLRCPKRPDPNGEDKPRSTHQAEPNNDLDPDDGTSPRAYLTSPA